MNLQLKYNIHHYIGKIIYEISHITPYSESLRERFSILKGKISRNGVQVILGNNNVEIIITL